MSYAITAHLWHLWHHLLRNGLETRVLIGFIPLMGICKPIRARARITGVSGNGRKCRKSNKYAGCSPIADLKNP
jgi:hypothetical protein